uniref:Uncharacterized protein n=1 Tax=Strigamia maritima TaxID=126957 RepID=T1J2E2_STRMM
MSLVGIGKQQQLGLMLLCAIGQQRSRMLAILFKDERFQQLLAYDIHEKMYLDQIIRKSELQEFASMLLQIVNYAR